MVCWGEKWKRARDFFFKRLFIMKPSVHIHFGKNMVMESTKVIHRLMFTYVNILIFINDCLRSYIVSWSQCSNCSCDCLPHPWGECMNIYLTFVCWHIQISLIISRWTNPMYLMWVLRMVSYSCSSFYCSLLSVLPVAICAFLLRRVSK